MGRERYWSVQAAGGCGGGASRGLAAACDALQERALRLRTWAGERLAGIRAEEDAQGTTEYAILVGVLVVIAIIAIIAFRDRISELWESISSAINSL